MATNHTTPTGDLLLQLAMVEEVAQQQGCSPLPLAACSGRHQVLALLLRDTQRCTGALSAQPAQPGTSSLSDDVLEACKAALVYEHPECLRVLLEASPLPLTELVLARYKGERTALMLAAFTGQTASVEQLLKVAPVAQVLATDARGWAALFYAVSGGHLDCVRALLRYSPGPQVASARTGNASPLLWAAHTGFADCVQLLLSHGPGARQLDTALFGAANGWAAERQQQQAECAGTVAEGQSNGTGTSTSMGGQSGQRYQRCMELLLSKGAMLTEPGAQGELALVRSVVRDLGARALAPDMANEAAAQAIRGSRLCEAARQGGSQALLVAATAAAATQLPGAGLATGLSGCREGKRQRGGGSNGDSCGRRRKA